MKETFGIVAFLVSIIALVFSAYGLYKYREVVTLTGDPGTSYVDSLVSIGVQNTINPIFSRVDDVMSFKEKVAEGKAIEDEFNSLPDKVLRNVATVVINREGHASRRSIVYEYRAKKDVYDNLPTSAPQTNLKSEYGPLGGGPVTRVDSGKTIPEGRVEYSQRDTTIGGVTYKQRTKKEISYE